MGTKTQKLSNVVDQIVEWQSVFTGDGSTGLTAVAGRGYFIDTTSGTVTVTLPASPKIGDIVQLKDYARTWGTNAVSIASTIFDGVTKSNSFSTNGETITLVYMDGTKGWSLINEDTTTALGATYITATGGTVTTSGDYKIHTFTGDGCFVVSSVGNPTGSTTVDYLVVAGGSGGAGAYAPANNSTGGGGGAGGYRESSGAASGCYTVSPLGACVSALPVSATTYPVTVGAGGAAGAGDPSPLYGGNGSNSVFSTITSAGGGGGGRVLNPGNSGGSGGGGGGEGSTAGGSGNTPPVSPPQGNNGGAAPGSSGPAFGGGGGGGATAAGSIGSTNENTTGPGGAGATSSINGTPTARAGGGGGGNYEPTGTQPQGGTGGGGNGALRSTSSPTAGTANTGGGGGGATTGYPSASAGGKGIVIIRYKYQ
jgi:hypothetical protein